MVGGRLPTVKITGVAGLDRGSEKWHIPDAKAKNRRKIACGGQSSPYGTHALCADNTRAMRDEPGGLNVNHLRLKPCLRLTESVTAP